MALFGPFLAILIASRKRLASLASNLLILWVIQSSDLDSGMIWRVRHVKTFQCMTQSYSVDLILAYAPLICLLCLLICNLTDARELSPKTRKKKIQFTARPKRRAIKRLGCFVDWAMLPLLSMMLSMELGNAMSIGHWHIRWENDSAFDIYDSTLTMESIDGGRNNREKRSAVRFESQTLYLVQWKICIACH